MKPDWKAITSAPIGSTYHGMQEYHYLGDVDPFNYGGVWINPDTGHVVELVGADSGLTDEKGRDIARIESRDVYGFTPRKIRTALETRGLSVADWLAMPKTERRLELMSSLHYYGYSDPSNEFPSNWYVETHRENAAFRAVNDYLR